MEKDHEAVLRGKRLKQLREERNLTQKELADFCGISCKLIQHYEQGAKNPKNMTVETLFRLSRGLDIPVERLIVKLFYGKPE